MAIQMKTLVYEIQILKHFKRQNPQLSLEKNIFTKSIASGLVLKNTQCFQNIHTLSRYFMSP